MIRLYLSLTHAQRTELTEHLYLNGYHFDWESEDILEVDEDEVEYVKTILYDMGIYYTE